MIYPERVEGLPSVLKNILQNGACMKRPITIHAMQSDCEFRVQTKEGDYKQGKAGDYLMCGVDGELYICDKDIFQKTYDFLPNALELLQENPND